MANTDHPHRKDVARISGPMGAALKDAFVAEKSKAMRSFVFTPKTAAANLTKAILPHIKDAVATGAARVGGKANDGLAAAYSKRKAAQIADTTARDLDAAPDTTTETTTETAGTPQGAVFDKRAGMALAIASGLVSSALNLGAQSAATSPSVPATTQPEKTWVVTQDNACSTCSDTDGETVPAAETFSNGASHPPVHNDCECTTDWSSMIPQETSENSGGSS